MPSTCSTGFWSWLGEPKRRHQPGRESGAEIVQDVGTVYEFEGESFRSARVHDDQAEAIEAAEAAASVERP
jgi:hypothetical protein